MRGTSLDSILCLLQAVHDCGTKEGLPLHGDSIKYGPGQVCVEVDLTSGGGLVHSIPGRPHSGLLNKRMSGAASQTKAQLSVQCLICGRFIVDAAIQVCHGFPACFWRRHSSCQQQHSTAVFKCTSSSQKRQAPTRMSVPRTV